MRSARPRKPISQASQEPVQSEPAPAVATVAIDVLLGDTPDADSPLYPRHQWIDLTPKQKAEVFFHFPSFCWHCLKVWTKPDSKGIRQLVPFRWNKIQREFIWPNLRKYRRVYFLKNRQSGVSTILDAFDFWLTITQPAVHMPILTHSQELQEAMRSIIETFIDNLPDEIKVSIRTNNSNGFKFNGIPGLGLSLNTQLPILTVSGKQKGIGKTLAGIHFTEMARYEDVQGGVYGYITTALQAIPPRGFAFIDTTPNGLAHPSYDFWIQAERGENGFKAVFIPWWNDDTCVMHVPDKFEILSEKEAWLLVQGASPANIMFRRAKMVEMNSPEMPGETAFDESYPSTPESCFISAGKEAFNLERLTEQKDMIVKRRAKWHADKRNMPRKGNIYLGKANYLWQDDDNGSYDIYEFPIPDARYVVGVDVGKGMETGDFSAMCVMNAETMTQAARFHGKPLPTVLGYYAKTLGYFYNTALIVVERNDQGPTALMELEGYPSLFSARKFQRGYAEETYTVGWHNNMATRSRAIDYARNMILGRNVILNSPELIDELRRFSTDKNGKYQAAKGFHDDEAWAFMVAMEGLRDGIFEAQEAWGEPTTEEEDAEIEQWERKAEVMGSQIENEFGAMAAVA